MNNLERLSPEERAEIIDRFFCINRSTITVAKLDDGSKEYGFFESLEDADELRRDNKFRLVRANQAIAYRKEKDRKARSGNPNYTIVIDCRRLVDLRMIHANFRGEIEVEVPGLKEYLSGKTKMTYREYLALLHKDSVEKLGFHVQAENELAKAEGFFDKSLFEKTLATKKEWQDAHNKYYSLLSYIKSNKIDVNRIFETTQ